MGHRRMIKNFGKRSFEESISQDRPHESAFVLSEASCFFVVASFRNAFWIIGYVATILFVCFDGGKTEKRDGDVAPAFFTNIGEAKPRGGR